MMKKLLTQISKSGMLLHTYIHTYIHTYMAYAKKYQIMEGGAAI